MVSTHWHIWSHHPHSPSNICWHTTATKHYFSTKTFSEILHNMFCSTFISWVFVLGLKKHQKQWLELLGKIQKIQEFIWMHSLIKLLVLFYFTKVFSCSHLTFWSPVEVHEELLFEPFAWPFEPFEWPLEWPFAPFDNGFSS